MARLVSEAGVVVNVDDDFASTLALVGYKPVGAGPDAGDDGAPKGNASRDEWAAYADSLGVVYPEGAGREDIKAAVADR